MMFDTSSQFHEAKERKGKLSFFVEIWIQHKKVVLVRFYICPINYKKYTMEEMKLIHKVENGELDMLGYIMLNPELKEPFSDYARGNGITCPTAADAVRFLKEYEERLYQELLP